MLRGPVQRVAAVTGAASGIGLAIAQALVEIGHSVAFLDVDSSALKNVASAPRCLSVLCDITSAVSVSEAIERVSDSLGDIEILVNCAGWNVNCPFMDLSDADAEKVVRINFMGVLSVTRAVLPGMVQKRWGRIVNISSDAARVGTPREAVYAGAKAAVIGFTKSLSAEIAREGITANVICPGTTDTPLLHAVLTPEQISRRAAANPTGRIGKPHDVASATLFFVSEEAAFVNGQVLSVSGGITRVG